MAEYTYMQENGEYVIYEDGAVLEIPNVAVVKTSNEMLAQKLISSFPDHTSPKSLLARLLPA